MVARTKGEQQAAEELVELVRAHCPAHLRDEVFPILDEFASGKHPRRFVLLPTIDKVFDTQTGRLISTEDFTAMSTAMFNRHH